MNKTKFEGYLNRYSLGGEVESVIIVSDGSTISNEMVSDDRTMIGRVSMEEESFPAGTYPVLTTSQLKQFLSVLDNNVDVSSTERSLLFKDEVTEINYMLAEPEVIPDVPAMKGEPEYTVTVSLDDEFVNRFIKSTSALSDSDRFTFLSSNGKSEIVLGYASQRGTNRISIHVNATTPDEGVKPISFSARYLKAILSANRGSTSSSMQISTEGLCKLSFTGASYSSQYYIVEIQGEA